jgi:hypothetical protein
MEAWPGDEGRPLVRVWVGRMHGGRIALPPAALAVLGAQAGGCRYARLTLVAGSGGDGVRLRAFRLRRRAAWAAGASGRRLRRVSC